MAKRFSGNFSPGEDKPRPTNSQRRARERAEEYSRREVGSLDAVDEFIAQAEGEIKWEDLLTVFRREGWEADGNWTYTNGDEIHLYESHRFIYGKLRSKKRHILRRTDTEGRIRLDAGPVRVPLDLPEILKRPEEEIDLVEGEPGARALQKRGRLATCIQGQHWTDEAAEPFRGRVVNVNMDNDDAGRDNTTKAVEALTKAGAKTIRVPVLPDLGPKEGLDDWLNTHTLDEYREIVARTKSGADSGPISVEPYNFPPEQTIATYQWLYGRHLLRGEVSGTAAMGGTGKSNLAIVEALAMATGKQVLHDSVPPPPLRVVLVNLEDSRNTMDKRIAAAMRHYKLTKADIGGRLFVVAKGELKLQVAKETMGRVERNTMDVRRLIDLMVEKKADVLSVDSLIRSHAVNENLNMPMTEVITCYEEVARLANCGVHLWHHTRKGNGDGASVESARGAQAFIDACRSVRILETMTKKEHADLLTSQPDMAKPGYYFREFNGKRNFAPPADESKWFKYVSVELANETSFEEGGDHVGVATPWQYPRADVSAAKKPAGRESALAAIAAGGPWRENHQSKTEPWVGLPIAAALGWDLSDKLVKKEVRKLVQEWLQGGHLRRVEARNQKRNQKGYIERVPH